MAKVVFIDDEHGPMDYYVRALKAKGHEVNQMDSVEKFLDHLDNEPLADVYVVDIMMPTRGNPRLKDAADGLATGIALHREIRRKYPAVPIILLTSIANPDVLDELRLEPKTTLESKIDTLPFELAQLVSEKTGS